MFFRHILETFTIFLALPTLALVPSSDVKFSRVVPHYSFFRIRRLEDNAIFIFFHVYMVIRLDLNPECVADVFGQSQQFCL